MTIENARAKVISAVWQAVAQSGVDLSTVAPEAQEKLVRKIADNVLLAMDEVIEDQPAAAPVKPAEEHEDLDLIGEETVLWQGRPFLSLVESYIITNERIKIIRGLVSRKIENFELIRIQDIDIKQGIDERMLGIGDIYIRGQDPSNPEITLRNISRPEELYETLRRAWLEARKRHGLQFREYM